MPPLTVQIIKGDGMRAERDAPPSEWIAVTPFVLGEVDGDLGRFPDRRPGALPVVEWLMGPGVVLYFAQRHDGLLWFEWQAIDALTQTAEKVAREEGGDWEMTPVFIEEEHGAVDLPCGTVVGVRQQYRATMRRVP